MGSGIQPVGTLFKGGETLLMDVLIASELPSIVVEDRIVLIGPQSGTVLFSAVSPVGPQTGDYWILTKQRDDIFFEREFKSGTLILGLVGAFRWTGVEWETMVGYIGKGGTYEQFSYELPPIGTPLEDFTWEQINLIGMEGNSDVYFNVNDTKTISVNSTSYLFEIVAFGHDDLVSGGKAPYTFIIQNCLNETYRLNPTDTNVGGYGGSEFRGILNSTIYDTMPEALRRAIKPVLKKTSAGNRSSAIVTSEEVLWQPSEFEMSNQTINGFPGEGTFYSKFVTNASRIKRVNGTPASYFTRSPNRNNNTSFCTIYIDGIPNQVGPSNARGAVFGFCV